MEPGDLAPQFLRRLGARIREVRTLRGWSQERLALECDLHRTYIGAVERGERNITVLSLRKIALALAVPASELVARADVCGQESAGR